MPQRAVQCARQKRWDVDIAVDAEKAAREVIPAERSVLIVEDDRSFLQRLAKALEQRGFTVSVAESVSDGLSQVEKAAPAFAVVDMRLGDGNGLDVISALKRRRPEARGIILTGYVMHFVNPKYASGPFHTLEGLLIMGFGLMLLNLECWLLDALRSATGVSAAPPREGEAGEGQATRQRESILGW